MGNRPRTLDHFPRMKVRGQRRRHYQRHSQVNAALSLLASIPWEQIAVSMARAVDRFVVASQQVAEAAHAISTDLTTTTPTETPALAGEETTHA